MFESHTHLLAAFENLAPGFNHSHQDARVLFELLPEEIRRATVARDRIKGVWRYEVGDPYEGMPDGLLIFGEGQAPTVERLYRTLIAIRKYLSKDDQGKFLAQLRLTGKHANFLEESAPLVRLRGPAQVSYEYPGAGNKTIDFHIETDYAQPILLDVKYRTVDLKHHLGHLNQMPENDIPPPEPEWIFAKVVEKLPRSRFEDQAQGAWIFTHVAQMKLQLHAHFDSLDAERLHFAILAADEGLGYILARTTEIEAFVRDFFSLTHNPLAVR
jgi:hypothetical protein